MREGPRSDPRDGRAVQRDLVVIAASAGGVEALQRLVATLPAEFPAPIMIVLHVAASGTSVLPQILSRRGPLPAAFAEDGEELQRGQIYVAPADTHMLVHDGCVHLTRGPRENGHRPAADALFRSAARARGRRTIGVVLSGLLDDGAAGLRFIKDFGGVAIVQDPGEALFPGMPTAALAATEVDRVVPIAGMARALAELIEQPVEHRPEFISDEHDLVELEPAVTRALQNGPPTALSCPECGGALWEHDDAGFVRYACQVGHAYSLHSLVEEQGRALEIALWSALRSLEERADMQRRMARRSGSNAARAQFEEQAGDADRHAKALREALGVIGRLAVSGAELEVGG